LSDLKLFLTFIGLRPLLLQLEIKMTWN
jgi:hypothetical protein